MYTCISCKGTVWVLGVEETLPLGLVSVAYLHCCAALMQIGSVSSLYTFTVQRCNREQLNVWSLLEVIKCQQFPLR